MDRIKDHPRYDDYRDSASDMTIRELRHTIDVISFDDNPPTSHADAELREVEMCAYKHELRERTKGYPKFRFEYPGGASTKETHNTVRQFREEHPRTATMLLEMMLTLGIKELSYNTNGCTATISIIKEG